MHCKQPYNRHDMEENGGKIKNRYGLKVNENNKNCRKYTDT